MRVLNDPAVDSGADPAPSGRGYQAQPNAADWDIQSGAEAGTGVLVGCGVTLHSGGAAVDVAAGVIVIDGNIYLVPATSNISITSGHASLDRIDQVLVAAGSTPGGASGTPAITTGAANILPAQKSLGKNSNGTPSSVCLATLTVIHQATTIASTDILEKRAWLCGRYLADGWCADTVASTRTAGASMTASTFTQSGDARRRFKVGTRIRWYESGTEKFGVVSAVAFASSTTTVTLAPNTDYWMAATPDYGIVFFSHILDPEGYPHWYNWTITFTGFSADPSGYIAKFRVDENVCDIVVRMPNNGTSNSTSFNISLPIAVKTFTNALYVVLGTGTDNSVALTTAVLVALSSGVTTPAIFATPAAGAWTASGGKRANFHGSYEI